MSLPVYSLYGLRLASDVPFSHPLPLAAERDAADLCFRVGSAPDGAVATGTPLWVSPEHFAGRPQTTLFAPAGGWQALRFAGVGEYWLGQREIVAVPEEGADETLVELRLLGPALALWLEREGVAALHAAAVVVDGAAVAFLASNHGGKSSLAAALMQGGAPLLTDDLLAVEAAADGGFVARPGYPQMRFWPAEARWFAGTADHPRVHPEVGKLRVAVGAGGFGRFHGAPCRLSALLLPQRGDEGTEARFETVAPSLAVVELMRRSFLPRLAAATDLQPGRLDLFARLAEAVPVRRWVYPAGYGRLGEACEALLSSRS